MTTSEPSVAVIGGGSWATAIVKVLTDSVQKVYWWVREPEIVASIQDNGHNPLYLSATYINPEKVSISNNLEAVIDKAKYLIFVVPSAYLHNSISCIKPEQLKGKKIVSAIKGIVPEKMMVVADYFEQEFGVSKNDIAVVSGPSHAEEVAQEKMTYLTCASENKDYADFLAELFRCSYIRTHTSNDIYGIEYANILKNVYAMTCGIFRGLGYGDNFQAALVANCMKETNSFLSAVNDTERSLSDSVYLGDLLVTAYSQYSRNRTFGYMIGKGYSLQNIRLEMNMVAEGYYAAKTILEVNKKYGVSLPIVEAVYNVLYMGKQVRTEMQKICNIII